jgi:hypothetical protein
MNRVMEDKKERKNFNVAVNLYQGSPMLTAAAILVQWAKSHPQDGSLAQTMYILSNECTKMHEIYKEQYQHIKDMSIGCKSLLKDIEVKDAALKPFADEADQYDDWKKPTSPDCRIEAGSKITIGDLRHAKQARKR